ncbi:hypothetical protein BE08_16655 [Sorangium cellulosum]|uniref:Uncharacterized protein n=1 Tax=Sorangium cellulosum TaxID=56 RepID=A0A150PQP3_SORCE|nr:hypothetical protein BE08_16655 [Sorangium cellulosum]
MGALLVREVVSSHNPSLRDLNRFTGARDTTIRKRLRGLGPDRVHHPCKHFFGDADSSQVRKRELAWNPIQLTKKVGNFHERFNQRSLT